MKHLKIYEKFIQSDNEYKIPVNDLNNTYNYFHISYNKLLDNNDNFTFTTRIPFNPYVDMDGNIIEDDFTKRISLGISIKHCLNALSNIGSDKVLYVYGIDLKNDNSDNIDVVNLEDMLQYCPFGYGEHFNLEEWLKGLPEDEYEELQHYIYKKEVSEGNYGLEDIDPLEIDVEEFIESPSDLSEKLKKMFYACVPDADLTKEFWSLNNIKMDYLGELNIDNNNKLQSDKNDAFIIYDKNGADTPKVIQNLLDNITSGEYKKGN